MKIVIINASPTRKGNCEKILNEMIKALDEHEIFKHNLEYENINACTSCRYCWTHPECIHNDDGNKILKELEEAQVLIFATPIFCGQMTAQAKLLTDRFFSIGANPTREVNSKAYLIFTHNQKEGFYDKYIEYTKNAPFGLINYDVCDVLDVGDLKNSDSINQQKDKLEEAYYMGLKIVENT